MDNFAVVHGQDSEPPFLSGNVGMFQNGRWATPNMRTNANFDWDVVALPDGPVPGGNWLFWGAYAANAASEHPEEAWQVLYALTDPEIQKAVSELGANIPSRVGQQGIDDFMTFSPPENNQAFLDGLANNSVAEGPLWAGSWPQFDTVMGPAIQGVVNGDISVEEFQATICGQANTAAFGD